MKRIAVLGSTGSIGTNTLKIAQHLGDAHVRVTALAAKSNIELLEQQARLVHPEVIAVYDKTQAHHLQQRLPHIPILAGMEGIEAIATHSTVDMVISAMSGTMGLVPTVAAIKAGKAIGLANKEALVSGGTLVMELARQNQVPIIPIDSEHSALFQCLQDNPQQSVRRLVLTASGGPFRTFSEEQLSRVTVEQALHHPNWNMGPKVTIDSSTLMNKGLEVIEAHWLFGIPVEQIDVVIHPQSIVHSLVEYVDGSMLAQLSEPTMLVPIQYALTYPDRRPGLIPPFDFMKNHSLQFYQPDLQKFRCLKLAFDVLRTGGSSPCYMNAANEVLVQRFVDKEIPWIEIGQKLETLTQRHHTIPIRSLEDILGIDNQAREEAQDC